MPANSDSTLCNRCRSIFNIYQEPTFLNDQCIPNADNTVMHHEGSSSFQKAVRDNCFICSTLNAENASATRAQLVKIGEGEYTVAIYTTAEDQLGRVTYFAVTKISDSTSLNVPASHHEELVQQWVSACQSKVGSHEICRARKNTSQPRRVIQVESDKTSGEIAVRLQDIETIDEAPYITVSHHDGFSTFAAVDLKTNLSSWYAARNLPMWLQQAAKVSALASIPYVWESTLCSHDGDRDRAAEIRTGGIFNIALLESPTYSQKDAVPLVNPSWAKQSLLAVYQSTMFRDAVVHSPLWIEPSFHQAFLLAPATLFVVLGEVQHLWWHCADGTLYSDVVATGVPIGDSVNSGTPGMRMLGTHTLNTQVLLAQLIQDNDSVSLGERLAALWTSIAMAYSQTDANPPILEDTANVVRSLVSHPQKNDGTDDIMKTYANGTFSGGLIYQLAWHGDPVRQESLPSRRRRSIPSWSWNSSNCPIVFEFLVSSEAAGLVVPYLDPQRAHIVPVATATFDNDSNTIRCRGSLLEADITCYQLAGMLQLADKFGEAAVHFDNEEEEERALKSQGLEKYVAWPVFAHVDNYGRLEARGVVLRDVEINAQTLPSYVRCAWFQYSSVDQESVGSCEELLKLARGDESMHKDFLIV